MDLAPLEGEAALCRRYVPVAQSFFLRHGRKDAEDLAHDAVIALLEALRCGRVRDVERPGAFLLGVCRNLLSRDGRSDERKERALSRIVDEGVAEQREPLVDGRKLWTCFSLLPARSRSVVQRTYVGDEDARTIAAALSMSEGNVRVVRHRALAQLLECLERGESP